MEVEVEMSSDDEMKEKDDGSEDGRAGDGGGEEENEAAEAAALVEAEEAAEAAEQEEAECDAMSDVEEEAREVDVTAEGEEGAVERGEEADEVGGLPGYPMGALADAAAMDELLRLVLACGGSEALLEGWQLEHQATRGDKVSIVHCAVAGPYSKVLPLP